MYTKKRISTLYWFSVLVSLLIFLSLGSADTYAQKNELYYANNYHYNKGIHFFAMEKYAPAQKYFEKAIHDFSESNSKLLADAKLYYALCALKQHNNNAEYLVWKFIEEHPESTRIIEAYFELSRMRYKNEEFREAISWLSRINTWYLTEKQQSEFHFMKGYSYYKLDIFDSARVAFFEIIHEPTEYTGPARYYYAHVNYEQSNYQTALHWFLQLEDDPTFSPITPYYITQIYFKQRKFEDITTYAPPLFETVAPRRKDEFARITGEAFYQMGLYDSALYYFEIYKEEVPDLSRDDHYRLGFLYYRANQHDNAIPHFEQIANDTSEMSQNALFLLGDCYLRMDDKEKAILAFSSASQLDKIPPIQRDALFNYAMLTYELSFSPFNDAITAFTRFLNLYPDSEKADIAFKFLMLSYHNTKNYKDAYESLQQIQFQSEEVKEAYQRVAYFRGIELYNNLQFKEATQLFSESLKHGQYDHLLRAQTHYWRAESHYRLEAYKQALDDYKAFISSPGVFEMPLYASAHYGIGYCYFKLSNWTESAVWFRRYIAVQQNKQSNTLADAMNRTGDAFFMLGDYPRSEDFYKQAIMLNRYDVDYALYQKGRVQGIQQKYQAKIATLKRFIPDYKNSLYYDKAIFEIGNSHFEINQQQEAIHYYRIIADDLTGSSLYSQALIQLGLIHYNLDKNEEGLKYYKQAVQHARGTSEEQKALTGIKNIYMSMNQPNAYFAYIETIEGIASITATQKDSLSYLAARNVYMQNDCPNAIRQFEQYIENFPKGAFELDAHYFLADCQYREKEYLQALQAYQYIVRLPRNAYTEEALLATARIHYRNEDYHNAIQAYRSLKEVAETHEKKNEAIIQIMRSYYHLKEYGSVIPHAEQVLAIEKKEPELIRESQYKIGKSYFLTGRHEEALPWFTKAASEVKSIEGAESKYYLLYIHYKQGAFQEAKKEIFDFIELNTGHRYWLAKSFLVLSDIYKAEKDKFQAIHTLRSIIDNYESQDDGIIEEAQEKLKDLTKEEPEKDSLLHL